MFDATSASKFDEKMAASVAQFWERLEALGERLGVSPHGDQKAFLEAAMAMPLSMSERGVLKIDLAMYRAQAPTSSSPTPGAPT